MRKIFYYLILLSLTALQLACGDITIKTEESSSISSLEIEEIQQDSERPSRNEDTAENNTLENQNHLCQGISGNKKNCTLAQIANDRVAQLGDVENCKTNSLEKRSCPTNTTSTENSTSNEVCFDPDGDGNGAFKSTTTSCKGHLQLDQRIYNQVKLPHNLNTVLSYQIKNKSCGKNLENFTADIGCLQATSESSEVFQRFMKEKGITKHGAITKFYKAGNTNNPLLKTMIVVSPYNATGSATIDLELNWVLRKAQKNFNSKLPTLLNYLHQNGISVLYVSFGHLANTSQPVALKAKALSYIIENFNYVRSEHERAPGFEALNIIGLSLGGVVAKKALTLIEDRGAQHKVNLYLSMDSPHLGAHVPLGLQRLPKAISNVFNYAKSKTGLAGVFDKLFDDILDLDFITDPLAQAADTFSTAATASNSIINSYVSDIPSNELIIYNSLAEQGLTKKEHLDMKTETYRFPKYTKKNIGITNGSITGKTLVTSKPYFELQTNKSNKVKLSFYASPRGISENYAYAWIEFPDRNKLFLGSRNYSYQYQSTELETTEDTVPCATTTGIIKAAEQGMNLAVSQNWTQKVKVHNYNSCFIPTGSSLALTNGRAFHNGSITSSQSQFDEIIGSSTNTEHMFFSEQITQQIIKKLESYR